MVRWLVVVAKTPKAYVSEGKLVSSGRARLPSGLCSAEPGWTKIPCLKTGAREIFQKTDRCSYLHVDLPSPYGLYSWPL